MIPAHLRPAVGHSAADKFRALQDGHDTTIEYNGHTFTVKPSFIRWTVIAPNGQQCKTEDSTNSMTDLYGAAAYLLNLQNTGK